MLVRSKPIGVAKLKVLVNEQGAVAPPVQATVSSPNTPLGPVMVMYCVA
jgi:hypothetical protein